MRGLGSINVLVILAMMLAGCKTVPLASRKQVNLLPESMKYYQQ